MTHLALYRQVRERFHCDGAFPTLYEKTRPEIN